MKKPTFETALTTVRAFRNIYAANYEKAKPHMKEEEKTANAVLIESMDVSIQAAIQGANSPGFRGEVVKDG